MIDFNKASKFIKKLQATETGNHELDFECMFILGLTPHNAEISEDGYFRQGPRKWLTFKLTRSLDDQEKYALPPGWRYREQHEVGEYLDNPDWIKVSVCKTPYSQLTIEDAHHKDAKLARIIAAIKAHILESKTDFNI